MPGAARVGVDIVGGGTIVGPGSPTVRVDGVPMSYIGDLVSSHGNSPHTSPTIITGSATVRADGRPVSVEGISQATCAHNVNTGSATTRIDG